MMWNCVECVAMAIPAERCEILHERAEVMTTNGFTRRAT